MEQRSILEVSLSQLVAQLVASQWKGLLVAQCSEPYLILDDALIDPLYNNENKNDF
jgi:hypothetical protein